MSIATSLSALQQAKTDIATAITNKGGTVNQGDGMSDFATDIGTIPTQSSYIVVTSLAGALLTCDSQTYQLGASETTHSFEVNLGSHTVTASKNGSTLTQTVVVDIAGAYAITVIPSRLPSAYQEVEYIQSTGSQYIDTLYVPTKQSKFVFNYRYMGGSDEGNFGGTNINGNAATGLYLATHNSGGSSITYRMYWYSRLDLSSSEKDYEVTFNDGGVLYVDRNRVGSFLNYQNFETTLNLFLFAINLSGTAYAYGKIKLYSMKIYDNQTTLVRNFVPCYRKSDDVAGLYDIVNNVFYTNQGTGLDFIVGEDV